MAGGRGCSLWGGASGRVLDSRAIRAGQAFEQESNVCPGFREYRGTRTSLSCGYVSERVQNGLPAAERRLMPLRLVASLSRGVGAVTDL